MNSHANSRIFSLFLILAVLVSSGCYRTRQYFLNNFQAEPIQTPDNISALETKYTNWVATADKVRTSQPPIGQAEGRNAVLSDLMRLSDYKYEKFKTKLYVADAGGNSLIDVASIGLTAAATLTGGSAGQILSGTDTALKGAQGKLAERWLNAKAMRVLLITMDSMRAEIRATLYDKMTNTYNAFPIEQGYELINRYHQAASLPNALTQMEATMSQQRNTNEMAATAASRSTLKSTNATEKLRRR